jgi:hypothetical protein
MSKSTRTYRTPNIDVSTSRTLQLLREEPRTRDEHPGDGSAIYGGFDLRQFVVRLRPPERGASAPKSRGKARMICCLYGDERRGIRRFIDVNEGYVKSCIEDKHCNPLIKNWDETLYQILLEEWEFRQYERADEDGEEGVGR